MNQESQDHPQELMEERLRGFQKDLALSSEAQKLLGNPMLQRFFQETEESLLDQWINSAPNQIEEREMAYKLLVVTRKFKAYFETFLANEEFALQQLAEMGHVSG